MMFLIRRISRLRSRKHAKDLQIKKVLSIQQAGPHKQVVPPTIAISPPVYANVESNESERNIDDHFGDDFEQMQIAMALSLSIAEQTQEGQDVSDFTDQGSSSSIEPKLINDPLRDPLLCFGGESAWANECAICMDDMFETEEGAYMLHCCHMFCKKCTREHVIEKLRQGLVEISCPLCVDRIDHVDMRELLDQHAFERWLDLSVKFHLENNKQQFFHCPTPNCPNIVEKHRYNVVRCPMCKKSHCSKCYNDHDEYVTCRDHEKWKELNGQADELFQNRVQTGHLVKCASCQRYIEKNGGCSNMKCRCGHQFTWPGW